MLFQTRKTFAHLHNTNEDIYDEFWEPSVPLLKATQLPLWPLKEFVNLIQWTECFIPNFLKRHEQMKFRLLFIHKHPSTHTSVVVNGSSSIDVWEPMRFILMCYASRLNSCKNQWDSVSCYAARLSSCKNQWKCIEGSSVQQFFSSDVSVLAFKKS